MEKQFYISNSPHITDSDSIPKIMFSVIGALVPAGIAGIYFFGWQALGVIITAVMVAILTEELYNGY